MRYIIGMVAAFACTATAPAHAAPAPVVLEPASPWNIRYDEDSCRLARMFGEGKTETAFFVERYEPSTSLFMVVAGQPLKWASRSEKMDIAFSPAGPTKEITYTLGNLGKLEPAIMSSVHPDQNVNGESAVSTFTDYDTIDEKQFSDVDTLTLHMPGKRNLVLKLGDMSAPMASLRKCTRELVTHWGIDVEKHDRLTRRVSPTTSPGEWIDSADYPAMARFAGKQGLVQFRLNVDAQGRATACHIQKATKPDEFADTVCRAMMENAHFQPALDANGQPIASYFRSAVRFKMPR